MVCLVLWRWLSSFCTLSGGPALASAHFRLLTDMKSASQDTVITDRVSDVDMNKEDSNDGNEEPAA